MIKYKSKIKDNHLVVKAKLYFGENFNQKELDAFTQNYIYGFLRPKQVNKHGIDFVGPIAISLEEKLKKPITKYELFFIIEQVVNIIQQIRLKGLSINKVILDSKYTYINETTKCLWFMYMPTNNVISQKGVKNFISSILYNSKMTDEKDTEIVSKFSFFIENMKNFDISKIENYIYRIDRSIVNTIKKHNSVGSGYITDKQKDYYEHYEGKSSSQGNANQGINITDEEATGLLDEDSLEDENTGLLEDEEATGLIENEEATGLLNNEDETSFLPDEEATGLLNNGDSTMLLNNEEATGLLEKSETRYSYPTLTRTLRNEVISINKPVFRIGKEKSYVDYFIIDNNAISRSHADIISRGNRYFVVDLNSKNRSFINDRVLPPQYEVEIVDGDILKLANEEFVFRV